MKINKMPLKDNDILQSIWTWIGSNWPIIYGALLAIAVSYGRAIYDGQHGTRKWVEAVLCGALSLMASSGLDYLGLSPSLSPFVGGMIGFLGVDKFRQISLSLINKKTGDDK